MLRFMSDWVDSELRENLPHLRHYRNPLSHDFLVQNTRTRFGFRRNFGLYFRLHFPY